jgi:hypothetical protein
MKLVRREYDPDTGITEEAWYGDGKLTLRRLQDVEFTLADNKAMFNMHSNKKPAYADSVGMHRVARIPFIVIEKWMREDGFNWYNSSDKERRARLNDSDYGKLLVRPGKL